MCKRVCVRTPHQQHSSSNFLVCYLLVFSLQLSFGPHCRLVSICSVVSCWRMPRTCENIVRLNIEHKQRTKCCTLHHFALSDGKNPRKHHSFSPRKWIKHCYLQGFVHVTIFDFLKNAYVPGTCQHFLRSSRQKIGYSHTQKIAYIPAFQSASKSGQNTAIDSSTFSWHFKNCVNTNIFCDQPAKRAVIYSFFLLCFQKHWDLQCFVHLCFKKYWYLQDFLRFCIVPTQDVKTQKCCNL